MLGIIFLCLAAVIFTSFEVGVFVLTGKGVSEIFFLMLSLALLPLWIEGFARIHKEYERSTSLVSASVVFVLLCGILFLHPSMIVWLIVTAVILSLFGFVDGRTLFLMAFTALVSIVIALMVEGKAIAEVLSLALYYCLVGGVFVEFTTPFVTPLLKRIDIPLHAPLYHAYIAEMRSFFIGYMRIAPFIFLFLLFYWLFQDSSWIFMLHYSVLQGMVFFLYLAPLFVRRAWTWK